MFYQIQFTFTESLQIAALIPCIFLFIYLLSTIKRKKLAVIPVMYFLSLAAGLLYRVIPVFTSHAAMSDGLEFILLLADSMIPALSFLLIIQMTYNTIPYIAFWLILLVPAVATTPFIYATIHDPIVCSRDIDICFPSVYALHLNMAIVSAFIFMLITTIFARISKEISGDIQIRKHKYWLIICLILYNLLLIGIEIGFVAEYVSTERYAFSKAMIEIAFIYMIMTSIFRVFTDLFEIQPVHLIINKSPLTEYELSVGNRAEKILHDEKIYREPGFNRANFAKKLGVREHVLSRIINMHFNKSFSELTNEYRIREAKELLRGTELSVTEIAYDVGFSSITSFNRVFKEATGKSPSEFRETAQKNIERKDA